MHIPDGFLSVPVWATLDAVSLPVVGYVARRAQRDLDESRIPLLGVMGAFVFAAQMINFPLPGTSAHLLGAALLTFTVGPWAAGIVMTAILAIQALVFQDGGILALGANTFNMAIVGVLAAYLPYRLLSGAHRRAAVFVGALCSVLAGASCALGELLVSGVPMHPAIAGAALALFVLAAVIEGAITLAVLKSIETMNPGWVQAPPRQGRPALILLGSAALLLAVAGVLIASTAPEVLDTFAARLGVVSHVTPLLRTPLSDYEASFFSAPWLRKSAAGLAGLMLVYSLCALLGRMISRRRNA